VAARATIILDSPAVNEAAEREGARKVRALVNGLPQEQKQALSMAFFDGLTQQEISETLQQPLGTIKARIRRGLMRLREGMEQFL
jgi:RNA polymerase sigma-70 factor (ECF subfamily)